MAKKLYTQTFTLPDGTRKYVRATSKEALDEKVTRLKMEMRAGVNISDNTTFAEFAQLWVDTYKRPHLREAGLNNLLRTLNSLIMPSLALYKLRDIKPVYIQRMMADIADYSHRSQSKALSTVRAIFDAAVDNGIIIRSPVPRTLEARGTPAKKVVPLTREQSIRLLTALKGQRVYIAVVLMLGLGLRREEALGLMWADVHFDKHYVHVCRTNAFVGNKNIVSTDLKSAAAERDIPMAVWVEDALREAKESSNSLYVAPAAGGGAMTRSSFTSAWDAVKSRTTFDPTKLNTCVPKHPGIVRTLDFRVYPHLLRHTCATRWVEQGFTQKEVQYMLGHSTPYLTMSVYAHYDREGQFAETVSRMRAVDIGATLVQQNATAGSPE